MTWMPEWRHEVKTRMQVIPFYNIATEGSMEDCCMLLYYTKQQPSVSVQCT